MVAGAFSSDSGDRIDIDDISGFNGGRLSATVILLRDSPHGIEVWVQERVSTMSHFPGATVFPGGGVDHRDVPERSWNSGDLWVGSSDVALARTLGTTRFKAHALLFAAVRELFEETGTLLAVDKDNEVIEDASKLHEERYKLTTHRLSLTDVLRHHNLKVCSDLLLPYARWIGCSDSGRWFDTHSFIAQVPHGQQPDADTTEASDANWFPPSLLIDGWRAGLVRLVTSTWAQLKQLSRFETVAEAIEAAHHADLAPIFDSKNNDREDLKEYFSFTPVDRIGDIPWA